MTLNDSQNLGHESLVLADYGCVKISSLSKLRIKLWLKEDGILHTQITFDIHSIHSIEGAKFMKNVVFFWP